MKATAALFVGFLMCAAAGFAAEGPGLPAEVVLSAETSAYSQDNPQVAIGAFDPGTRLAVEEFVGAAQSYRVKFVAPDGKTIVALCRTEAIAPLLKGGAGDTAPARKADGQGAIVVINLGQSNAVGRADPDPAEEVAVPPGVYEFKPSADKLAPLGAASGEGYAASTARSMNPMLGRRLKELTGRQVIILPAARGNTSIHQWNKGGELYSNALKWARLLQARCEADKVPVSRVFIHWLQGENDAGHMETEEYLQLLGQLADDLVADFQAEKIFCTRIGYDPDYCGAEGSEKIMRAQKLLAQKNGKFILATCLPATFTPQNGRMKSDRVHYTQKGLNEVGRAVAAAMAACIQGKSPAPLDEPVAALRGPAPTKP